MKTRILLFLVAIAATFSLRAADLIVEEFGTFPTYPSLNSALTAATSGDRIVVKNRAGDIPWIENLSISKSITFVSYTNNTQWIMQGTITIASADGREINFIGMKNTAGGFVVGTSSGANRGTKVNIMDCNLVAGNIALGNNTIETNVISSKIDNGQVVLNSGNVIGNYMNFTGSGSTLYYQNNLSFAGDTCFIVGNKVLNNYTSGESLHAGSSGQVLHIRNNYITYAYVGLALSQGVSNGIQNLIWNNTITTSNCQFSTYALYVGSLTSGSVWEIMNNIIDETISCTSYGIYRETGSTGATVNAYYNHIDPSHSFEFSGTFTFQGSNTTTADIVLDSEGQITSGVSAINGANPAQPFYDLDLTVGDAGCYGGSYSLNNFFPLFTGSSRVYFVKFPFNVRQGSTLNFKAYGYDR